MKLKWNEKLDNKPVNVMLRVRCKSGQTISKIPFCSAVRLSRSTTVSKYQLPFEWTMKNTKINEKFDDDDNNDGDSDDDKWKCNVQWFWYCLLSFKMNSTLRNSKDAREWGRRRKGAVTAFNLFKMIQISCFPNKPHTRCIQSTQSPHQRSFC